MPRASLLVVALAVTGVAHAQPAPDAAPAPEPAPAPVPVEPAPPAPVPVEPAPPPPAPITDAPPLRVTYDKGLAFAAPDGAFALKLAFRNQLRFESTRPTEDGAQFQSRFSIPRARFQAEGHVFGPTHRYKLELGLGDTGSFAFVRDLFIDKRVSAAPVWLRAGMWKRPFNRQELVSDFASEFNERAITAAFAGGGRDLGLAVHNDYEKSPDGLEWAVGIFNAFSGSAERPQQTTTCTTNPTTGAVTCTTTAPTTVPADFAPAIVARAGWNTGGIKGYSEGDLEGGPLRVAVGASYKIDLGNFAKQREASVADNLSHGLQADAMIKAHGASLQLGVYMMKLPASRASNRSADAGFGAFAQAGYMLVPARMQVAGRVAIAPDARAEDRDQLEARVAFNLFWEGHTWKWATDAGILQLTGEDPTTMTSDDPELQLRSMLQLSL